MVWRQRLDVTTNWAITSSTAIITIAFSTREVPHIIFFFNLAIVAVLLWIESRRYRFYDAFRARIRMLEAHFLVPMVMENRELLQGEWKKLVCEDLILPSFKITKLEAIGRRLKRNYVFIFILILVAWLTKIFLHASAPINDVLSFYHALSIGHIPSWVVAMVFVGCTSLVHGQDKLQYNRDVRPLLTDACFKCHGPDAAKAAAGLRLDSFDLATHKRSDGAGIVPKDPDRSLVVIRHFPGS